MKSAIVGGRPPSAAWLLGHEQIADWTPIGPLLTRSSAASSRSLMRERSLPGSAAAASPASAAGCPVRSCSEARPVAALTSARPANCGPSKCCAPCLSYVDVQNFSCINWVLFSTVDIDSDSFAAETSSRPETHAEAVSGFLGCPPTWAVLQSIHSCNTAARHTRQN